MNETIQQIVNALVPILCLLITAGGGYLVALLRKRTALLQQEIDNDLACKYIDMAVDAVDQAVTYTAQTFVDALKSENAFTKDKQLEAFNIAKDKVLEILGDTVVKYLNEIYGDFETWLETRIEQVCREIKQPETITATPTVLLLGAATAETETVEAVEPEVGVTEGEEPEAAEEPQEADEPEPEPEDPDADYEY